MIKVENLTKIYESKKTKCEALKNVSFVLPETGLIFILGKSGSGKSTLLNLLGGLDEITGGDITVDGKKYSEFSVKDFDNFRNEKLGFIFQDFCLIEELTVEENVRLVMDLQTRDDYSIIASVFQAVGLDGLEERHPKELSAGQKQRVAIARAIVKDPRIILADEPTGNIDSKTSAAVLDTLKNLSKDRLVVIISHNNDDAYKYGDRIIEIADGEIVRDETKEEGYSNGLKISLPEITLPYGKKMDAGEMKQLNEAVRDSGGNAVINQCDSGFAQTVQPENAGVLGEYKSKALKPKKLFEYSAMFFKRRWLSVTLTVFVISFLIIVFGMAQLFTMFDGSAQIAENVQKYGDNGIIIRQGYYDETDINKDLKTNNIVYLDDENVAEIEGVYDGNIYKMYNVGLQISRRTSTLAKWQNLSAFNIRTFFANETNGTLVCDIDYLKRLYGDDDNLTVLAGEIKQDGGGVIITDYVADSILAFNYENRFASYDDIVNADIVYKRIFVDAIIDTGYTEKYQGLMSYLAGGGKWDYYDEATLDFFDEALNYLSVCYSVNPDFIADFLYDYQGATQYGTIAQLANEQIAAGDEIIENEFSVCLFSNALAMNETKLSVEIYNKLYGTTFTDDDAKDKTPVPEQTVTITLLDINGNVYFDETLTVVGLVQAGDFGIADGYVNQIKGSNIGAFALYTENSQGVTDAINLTTELDMYQVGYRFGLIRKITNIVNIFDDIFLYIGIALCAVIVIVLVLNSVNNIKRNAYQIGVMRAMGARTGQLTGIFVLQTLATGLAICILTILGSRLGVILFNNVLLESMTELLKAPGIGEITILVFDPAVVCIDVGIILLLTIISVVVPLLAVRRVQPIKIIRSRE